MEQQFKFDELNVKQEGTWLKRNFWTAQAKRTMLAILTGALIGTGYFYLTEARNMVDPGIGEYLKSALLGAFLGFFITNSPCARGRC